MDKFKLSEIDFNSLEKLDNQGTSSTIYTNGNKCIKMLDDFTKEERETLKRKLLELDGIKLKRAIVPDGLILDNDELVAVISDYFKYSSTFYKRFGSTRFVNVAEMFKALYDASLGLRELHDNKIICQDLSFSNILIDIEGNIKFCDLEGCFYNGYKSPYISILLRRFINDYHKRRNVPIDTNLDRISLLISFFKIIYAKEIQNISNRKYNTLSKRFNTLENAKEVAKVMKKKGSDLSNMPYIDELIDKGDHGNIDRLNQLSIIKKLTLK